MADQVSPFIRTVFTDITGPILSHQMLGKCATQEMNMMDCIEAYGWDRGSRKCKPFIEEFKECQTNTKQFKRFMDKDPYTTSSSTALFQIAIIVLRLEFVL